jgi:hypothetical protein
MKKYVLNFSVCKKAILDKKKVLEVLKENIPNIKLIAIEMEDSSFQMHFFVAERVDILVIMLMRNAGFSFKFLSFSEYTR